MPVRSLAIAAALAAFASPAFAQSPTPGGWGMSHGVYDASPNMARCRERAYNCAIQAYDYFGPASAVAWFRRAASEGSAPAMRSLGFIYLRGAEGVPADPEEALGWLYEAALRDDAAAMHALGRAFEEGVGVEADPRLGRAWIARAAARGYAPARLALSVRQ